MKKILQKLPFLTVLLAVAPASAQSPPAARDYDVVGRSCIDTGDLDAACDNFTKAIALDPNDAEAHSCLGMALFEKGNRDGATKELDRALELNPKSSECYFLRGIVRYWMGRTDDSIADYAKAMEIEPASRTFAAAWIWVARSKLGNKAAADQELAALLGGESEDTNDYPVKVMQFLLDKITETDLFDAGNAATGLDFHEKRCSFWYYAGIKKLLAGEQKAAASDFRKSLAAGRTSSPYYISAEMELKALAK